ncbi:hypothetical protein H6G33_00585 [Calothrix sp. FACHB-1219]|uniref:hypothetical protein n=1 Tax=unclassified Calothrix TaxID=2619626 RepID=UPI001688F20D|nr:MULTISPECIES: hypothetical protein [unclassified Calothrix]MBD2201098.1 hypothetical protein [Calothrix sp. FACHB-168]MBD2215531.1 hypothetical protein [Calothrix sp. FACHB-1219]
MATSKLEFCFCTLAFGNRYISLALLLAKDLEKYSPNTCLVVLTDNTDNFNKQTNVLAYKHKQQSVKLYHDKRFVLEKALLLFDSCIFIDADMRILKPVPQDMTWLKVPGISARACEAMCKRYGPFMQGNIDAKDSKEFKEFIVTQKAAKKLDIELKNETVKHLQEYLFTITKDSGKETEFLKQWEILAPFYEINGVYAGEGNAIGLAAAKAGLQVRWTEMPGISFFKDRTELIRIENGQSKMEEMSIYFEQQIMLEHPQYSLLQKIGIKVSRFLKFLYNLLLVRVVTLKDFNFYYR